MQTGNSTGTRLADTPRVLAQQSKQNPDQYPDRTGRNEGTYGGGHPAARPAQQRQPMSSGGTRVTRVFVFGCDRLSQAGMVAYLRDCPGIELVPEAGMAAADVTVVAAEGMDESSLLALRAVQQSGARRTLLVVGEIEPQGVTDAFDAGVIGILRRASITHRSLSRAIASAQAGESVLPTELLTRLVRQVNAPRQRTGPVGPNGQVGQVGQAGQVGQGVPLPDQAVEVPPAQPHSDRELAVLRMLGEGCDTREIARRLAYSERTVKTVIQELSQRLGLRNRSHAVAYAVRNGLI